MVCRNPERGQEAVQRIIESTGNKDVHLQVESKHLARGIHEWLKEIHSRLSLSYCLQGSQSQVSIKPMNSIEVLEFQSPITLLEHGSCLMRGNEIRMFRRKIMWLS